MLEIKWSSQEKCASILVFARPVCMPVLGQLGWGGWLFSSGWNCDGDMNVFGIFWLKYLSNCLLQICNNRRISGRN